MTNIKKLAAGCLAALSVAGALCVNAFADDLQTSYKWSAKGRNIPGAPTSVTSLPDDFYIWQKKIGATATMSGISHTIPGASSRTNIYCTNYEMNYVEIYNYASEARLLFPSVGEPRDFVKVYYKVYVSSNTSGDTVVSNGTVEKIGK